jgi:hypothetical protein
MYKPEFHVVVNENHTVNGLSDHHHYQLDVTASEMVDYQMLQHLVNFGREAINHGDHPKKYFATSPPKKEETPTYVLPCFK